MKLATNIQAEKGKEIIKTANEYIFQEFTVNKIPVGQIELYYFDDAHCLCKISNIDKDGLCEECGKEYTKDINEGEWLLKYRKDDNEDWDIIAQGNI